VNYPLGDFGRAELPRQPKIVAFQNATLWTCEPAGIIAGGTLVISEGKILAVGTDVKIPDGAEVIDAAGRAITPGIIDCHSHMATDGGTNEVGQAITAEVRIGDFIDADDITIYRQLAGGVTAANVLHGSANPIGGQNQVIKLRWGATGEGMKFATAPPGIKFALGENVKQSNLEGRISNRYPQSRMGVEQLIRDAFAAARDYAAAHERWNQNHAGLPPRRDLELEALAEIVQGRRWIHCHSYRQDEILALLRTCDAYGIQIGSLQHILEGYKLGDAIARHGATGSSFSDWWAYKFEVIDSIPFNGALMHRAGVVVSFNSDDDELGRHLNHEAAKAVKYGGVPREEALKFVTLNPAKQLRIDRWVGSLAAGKDADFVVWSGDPLSPRSRCEQTWIDGRNYFDRAADRALQAEQAAQRAALIRKVIESGQTQQPAAERRPEEWDRWLRYDEFCQQSSAGR
jgi:imidazolonepropionase-like amidohydrolase